MSVLAAFCGTGALTVVAFVAGCALSFAAGWRTCRWWWG